MTRGKYFRTKEYRDKVSKSMLGKKYPKDNRSFIMDKRRQPHTEEHKMKISLGNKGKSKTEEHKRKLGLIRIGIPLSAETKEKLRKAHLGKSLSEEHKKNISKANKGKTRSEETRRKIGEAHIGKYHSAESKEKNRIAHLGKIPWNKGIPFSKQTDIKTRGLRKIKISDTLKRLYREGKKIRKATYGMLGRHHSEQTKQKLREFKGNKSSGWLGGMSFEPYGIDFNKEIKNKIRERDNLTCQECGKIQSELKIKLHTHHIDYNKQNNNPLNLISLCRKCHVKTNGNREHWKNYFKMKIFIKELFNPLNINVFNENKQLIGILKCK